MANSTDFLISNVDELICTVDQDFQSYSSILDQIVGHVIKKPQHIASFISYVNGQLSNAPTRQKGLILLNVTIPMCPYDTIAEHAIAWINNSLKYCENESNIHYYSFKVLKPLLSICSKTPELNKALTSSILGKIIEEVKSVQLNSTNSIVALECLDSCLRIYPGSCGSFKTSLEKYLISYLDSPLSTASVRIVGKCLHALQQVGGGGVEGTNHKLNWKKQQQCLCATIHSLMDEFFESVTEFGDFQQEGIAPLDLPKLPEGKNFKLLAQRIINATIFLQEMLLGAYSVAKSVMPVTILNVVSRGLTVTNSTLGTHVVEDLINLSSYLCLIQKNLLQLLQCLMTSLGTNIIPYATLISKLIINNIKSIPSQDVYIVKSLSDLHITAYDTLILWMTIAKASSSVSLFLDILLPTLMADVMPSRTEVNLMVQKSNTKNMNKKARKKLQEQVTSSFAAKTYSNSKHLDDINYRSDVCATALKALQAILSFEGSLINPIVHKQLQEFVVKTLYNIQRGKVLCPYNKECCQIELYNTLLSLVVNHHWNITPPLEYAIQLLSKGQSDSNSRISQISTNGLANLNAFIHPPFASLELPLDINNLRKELDIEQKNTVVEFEMSIDVDDNEKVTNGMPHDEIVELSPKQTKQEQSKENNDSVEKIINDSELVAENVSHNSPCDENEILSIQIDENEILSIQIDEKDAKNKEDDSLTQENLSIAINISSDEEVMETLTIDGDDENENKITETEENNDKNGKNPIKNIHDDAVLNIDEEEMCKAFVDIVNE